MSMTWRVAGLAWLSWVVVAGGAGEAGAAVSARGVPGGGFPAEGVEFLVVSPGHGECLSLGRGRLGAVGTGRPCEWEAPGAEQRWRYHAGRLVNVASGACLLAASLGPCEAEEAGEVSYELLAQRLVLQTRAGAGCFLLEETGVHQLGLASLDSRECGAEHVASKWMLVPL